MIKLSKLYIKIYIYFLAVVLFLVISIPNILFRINKLPPHYKENTAKIVAVINFVSTYYNKENFNEGLRKISKETGSIIGLYDKEGNLLVNTGEIPVKLDENIIPEVNKNAISVFFIHDRPFLVFCLNKSPFFYISISTGEPHMLNRATILILLGIIISLSILVYPLTRYLTKPLEEITKKALKISKGDFTVIETDFHQGSGDEITQLTEAFYHMAYELSLMIESKKELISDISHELGSPLSRMQVSLDIIEDDLMNNELPDKDVVGKLSRNIKEMSRLLKELLDLSRIDTGYVLNKEKLNIQELIFAIIQKFQLLLEKKNIKIEIYNNDHISEISADKSRLSRLFENLLLNAIEYSPPGGIIAITLKKEHEEHFSVTIKDDGPGIKKENREKIFTPFFREDVSRTRETGGTGLGLAIAKKIVILHDGDIWLENPGQKGARITFKI
jgi:signal transduction histidine kinase